MNITVNGVNDAPVAVDDAYSVAEEGGLTVPAADGVLKNDTDADSTTLTATKVAGPAHGTVTLNANGSFSYTPAKDYSGADSFTYKANDGTVDGNTATANITVTAVNDAPTISDIANATTNEDETASAEFTVGDADHAATALVVTGSSDNTELVPNANVTFDGAGATRTVRVQPAANASGTATITVTVTVTDPADARSSDTFLLTVTAVNDAPVALNDAASIDEDVAVSVAAAGNDTDVDREVLRVKAGSITAPANGTAELVTTTGATPGRSGTRRTPTSTALTRSPTRPRTAPPTPLPRR